MGRGYQIIAAVLAAVIGWPAWAHDVPDHGPLDPLPAEARHYRLEDDARHLVATDTYTIIDDVLSIDGRDATGLLQQERRFRVIAGEWRCHANFGVDENGIRHGVEYEFDAVGRPIVMTVLRRDAAGALLDDAQHRARNTYAYTYDDAGRLRRGPISGHIFEYTWDGENYEAVARTVKRFRVSRWSSPEFRRQVSEERYVGHQFVYNWHERTEHLNQDGNVRLEVTAGVNSSFSGETPGTSSNRGISSWLMRSDRIWQGPRLVSEQTTFHSTTSLPERPQASVSVVKTAIEYSYPP